MTHHWEALGWTLVHFLWQGAAIALVYRVADLALARRSATARYVLALGALLVMLAVSVGTLAYEESILASRTNYFAAARIAPGRFTPGRFIPGGFTPGRITPGRFIPGGFTPDRFIPGGFTPDRRSADFVLRHLMPYLDVTWFAGVLLLSLRTLGGWWLIRRMKARLQQAPHTLLLRLDVLRRQMNIPRFVDLRRSTRLTNPLTAGVFPMDSPPRHRAHRPQRRAA
jgi:hypothetical protein